MGGGGEAAALVRFIEAAIDAIADDVGDAAPVGGHDRTAGSHRFEQHQAQGFGAGGEEEGIGAGVGAGQVGAGHVAHEGGGGAFEDFFQLGPVGAIAHQGQAAAGQGFQHGADPVDLLFGREAADVEQQAVAGAVAA